MDYTITEMTSSTVTLLSSEGRIIITNIQPEEFLLGEIVEVYKDGGRLKIRKK